MHNMPMPATSSAYLAQRVGTRHAYVCTAAKNALTRGAAPRDFRPVTIPTAANLDVPGFLISTAGIEQLAIGQELAGNNVKAAIYREITDELRHGELRPLPTVIRKDGREVLAPNQSEAKNEAKKAKRRKTVTGASPRPMFQRGTGRPGFEMIESALFVGCQSSKLRRSVAKLLDQTDALGSSVFPVTTTRRTARGQSAELDVPSFALTAEAMDELAEQFDRCKNAIGRNRAGAFRELAAHLRALVQLASGTSIAAE